MKALQVLQAKINELESERACTNNKISSLERDLQTAKIIQEKSNTAKEAEWDSQTADYSLKPTDDALFGSMDNYQRHFNDDSKKRSESKRDDGIKNTLPRRQPDRGNNYS